MGLAELKKQIIEDAEKQARLLLDNAKKEAKKLLVQAKQETNEYSKNADLNTEKMIEAARKKKLAASEFDGRKLVLDAKKKAISCSIEQAKGLLQKMSEPKRKRQLDEMLANAQKEIDVAAVYVNRQDIRLITDKSLTVKPADISGGLIAETSDGRISINLSHDSVLEEIKETYLRELSEVLFGG